MATVGRIHPHLEARVVDPQTGRTLPRGQVGGGRSGRGWGAGMAGALTVVGCQPLSDWQSSTSHTRR